MYTRRQIMILTDNEYKELIRDFNFLLEKVDGKYKSAAVEQVKQLEIKYWGYVKKVSFSQYLRKTGDLNKVLWLLDAIIDSKRNLKKMQPNSKSYSDLLKEIRYWQRELYLYWKDYGYGGSISDFSRELRKIKWLFLRCENREISPTYKCWRNLFNKKLRKDGINMGALGGSWYRNRGTNGEPYSSESCYDTTVDDMIRGLEKLYRVQQEFYRLHPELADCPDAVIEVYHHYDD